jgi:hypothetical protein
MGRKARHPMILLLGMTLYPHWLLTLLQKVPRRQPISPPAARRGLGAANGQFLFFTRRGYEQIGGHEAIRGHLVEDVALGRAIAAQMHAGLRLVNCDALRFSTCRMYRSFAEVWEASPRTSARPSKARSWLCLRGALQISLFLLPFSSLFSTCTSRRYRRPDRAHPRDSSSARRALSHFLEQRPPAPRRPFARPRDRLE